MLGISLNNRSPIHEQLTEKITELVLKGVLEPESPLPSVRELAAEMGVNPNTIQRAYSELERRGVTYSVTGKGRFVTDDVVGVLNERRKERMEVLTEDMATLAELGVTEDEIITEVKNFFKRRS